MDFVLSSIFTQLNEGEIEKTVGYDREFLVKMVEYSSPYHALQNFTFLGHDQHPNSLFYFSIEDDYSNLGTSD
ncbi:hypothetical protein CUM97_14235 [Enterococcus mundtii]|nr:hypothetical protein CUM97_14235 [Enterococcus mundtii]